ncbi:MAG: sigma-70 family RNA polymerase sigma factor [Planctomycetaceae bacterium]
MMNRHTNSGVPGDNDSSLLHQFCEGSEDAAERLYSRYGERLRRLADHRLGGDLRQRVDADDIVQSVFRTFFRRAVQGDYELPDGEELWSLLVVIGLNKVRGQAVRHRAQRRDVSRTTHTGDVEVDDSGLMVLRLAIDDLLMTLPASHREIIELRIDRYEVGEIAEVTKRSRRTVERVLQQFREHLREILWPEHDDAPN